MPRSKNASETIRRTPSVNELWKQQLYYQWQVTRHNDISFLYNQASWLKAKHVLEVGCGTGHFLEHIASQFSDKLYKGVDIHPDVLRRGAFIRRRNPHVQLYRANLLWSQPKWKSSFDFVIARLVLQHLPSIDEFLARMSEVLKPRGTLLIYDANDTLMKWSPAVPSLESLLEKLSQSQKKAGVGRSWWNRIRSASGAHSFEIIHSTDIVFSSAGDEQKRALFRMFNNLGPLVVKHFGLNVELRRYRRELLTWLNDPNSYGQFGMRAILLRKKKSFFSFLR